MSKQPPVFPESFYKHCPKVQDAKHFHKTMKVDGEFVEREWAECAFINAGVGKECENCRKFLTRPYLGHKVDEEFLPLIEKFYNDLDAYEKSLKKDAMRDEFCQELNLDGDELVGLIVSLRWFRNTPEANQQVGDKVRFKMFTLLNQLEERYFEIFKESI